MGEQRQRAAAAARELMAGYPSAHLNEDHAKAYAKAFTDMGLDIADDVSALLRIRSQYAPSVAELYATAREVRQETMSPQRPDCVFEDGVTCPRCEVIHGHLLSLDQQQHGMYHLKRHRAGTEGEFEAAKWPESCDCRERVDVPLIDA
jgi:hypothetical protein